MPITTFNKTRVPVGSDPYALTADLKTLAEGLNVPIPVADAAERDALPAYEGLTVVRLDRRGQLDRYVGGAWTSLVPTDVSTFGPGWSALTGAHKPRVLESGGVVHLFGGAGIGTSGNIGNILTVPAGFAPQLSGTHFIGSVVTSGGVAVQLAITSAGVVSALDSYRTGSIGANSTFPLRASWPLFG